MANRKLTDLPELLAPADGDFLYIVDVSDTTESLAGTSKKIKKVNTLGGTYLTDQLDFEANGIDDFVDIGTTNKVKSFFYGSVLQITDDWTQVGSIIQFTFTPDAGSGIKNLSFI